MNTLARLLRWLMAYLDESYCQARHVRDFCDAHNEFCQHFFARCLDARQPGWLDSQRADVYNDDIH